MKTIFLMKAELYTNISVFISGVIITSESKQSLLLILTSNIIVMYPIRWFLL